MAGPGPCRRGPWSGLFGEEMSVFGNEAPEVPTKKGRPAETGRPMDFALELAPGQWAAATSAPIPV
jgi:hypothetical protein